MALKSPYLGDKLTDWHLLELIGGQGVLLDRDVVEYGPSYGIDLMMWAPWTKSYIMIESAPEVIHHLDPMIEMLHDMGHGEVALFRSNLKNAVPLVDGETDVVLDFGTVDNVLAGFLPFHEAGRILRPGGLLITTYANLTHFKERFSSCGDEERFSPDELARELSSVFDVVVRFAENQPRAGMALRKK